MPELTRRPEPGDIVDTPHGRGYLLHAAARTKGKEWIVMIGTKGHIVSIDDMVTASTRSEDMSKASTLEPMCTNTRTLWTSPEDMSTAGTQLEMGI